MGGVRYDSAAGGFTGDVKLQALTRITIDGDTALVMPAGGAVDQALWTLHAGMVERAQVNRNELIKTASAAAAALLGSLKPT